jgi:unsaturated rhamnogalacturonyl hydrolase
MKNQRKFWNHFIILSIVLTIFLFQDSLSQPVAGLDNWFNRETNAKTGQPFHYLWTDTEWSGYSRWGEIFTSRGAKITTIEKPDLNILKNLDVYIIVDPDTTTESKSPNYIMAGDIKAIKKWVKKGGVLAVLANDAPNCEFTNLNKLMRNFGMSFNHVTFTRLPVQILKWSQLRIHGSSSFQEYQRFILRRYRISTCREMQRLS